MRSSERPIAYSFEKSDCTVRALASATGVPYERAHEIMKSLGRRDRQGVRGYKYKVAKALEQANVDHIKIDLAKKNIKTPVTLVRQYPTSTILCSHRGHAFTVKQGKITDNTGKRVHLHDAWIIIKKGTLKHHSAHKKPVTVKSEGIIWDL